MVVAYLEADPFQRVGERALPERLGEPSGVVHVGPLKAVALYPRLGLGVFLAFGPNG